MSRTFPAWREVGQRGSGEIPALSYRDRTLQNSSGLPAWVPGALEPTVWLTGWRLPSHLGLHCPALLFGRGVWRDTQKARHSPPGLIHLETGPGKAHLGLGWRNGKAPSPAPDSSQPELSVRSSSGGVGGGRTYRRSSRDPSSWGRRCRAPSQAGRCRDRCTGLGTAPVPARS